MNIALLASGGVDSAVATHLMCERGEHPTLFYIKIGADEEKVFTCTMEEDLEMVNMLAKQYGLSLEVIDLHQEYWSSVVKYLIERVKLGLTPNPDVMCNSLIKFAAFYDKVGCDFDMTVTGHYATTVNLDGVKYLASGIDPVKDQTDFLCQITPAQLAKLHFPVGSLMKGEVRNIAQKFHLAPAKRKDSQGICFLGNTNYNTLLNHYLGDKEGDIIEWETGKVLGKHQGYWYYTLGQRKGLRLGGGPWFVVSKDIENNIVYITREIDSPEQLCNASCFELQEFHTIATNELLELPHEKRIYFKIRHSPEFETGTFSFENGHFIIRSDRMIRGLAPGQFAVVYYPYSETQKLCIGSGEIKGRL